MKKTGELLKKSREEKQLSIHEIGLSLKINSKILKALEDGDTEGLPAKTFLRGFVQSYAQYLKLNSDEVLKLFASEMGTTKPQSLPVNVGIESTSGIAIPTSTATTASKKESPVSTDTKPLTITSGKQFRNVTMFASIIVLVTLILITKKVIDRYQNEALTPVAQDVNQEVSATTTPATSNTESTPPLTDNPPTTTAPPLTTVTTPPNPPPAMTAPTAPPPATPASQPTTTPFVSSASTGPVTSPAIKTATTPPPQTAPIKPVDSKPAIPAASTSAEVKVDVAPLEIKPAIKNVELIIEALDAVDIEYSTSTGKNEKMRLEPEQLHTIKTKAGLKLNVSNGGAVNIIVNGKDVGVPGILGKPIKLTY